MARPKKEPAIHTLRETIDKAYSMGFCSKAIYDIDTEILTTLGLIDISGTVEQLATLLAIIHDYLALCTERQVDVLDSLEDEVNLIKDKKHHYDA